nr:hypothetical protein [Klebsiella pneumoniae]
MTALAATVNQTQADVRRADCHTGAANGSNHPASAVQLHPSVHPANTSAGKCIPAAMRDQPTNVAYSIKLRRPRRPIKGQSAPTTIAA